MTSLEGTVALVTGASRGAGKGIALVLGEHGATVYVTGRSTRAEPSDRPGTIDDTADEVSSRGGSGIAVQVDHTDRAQVTSLVERIANDHGRLDVLVDTVKNAVSRMSFGMGEQLREHRIAVVALSPG
jgi:NAD(P)-dependent dehydrogenase (short-subunit alcohol dehydrogenase family)